MGGLNSNEQNASNSNMSKEVDQNKRVGGVVWLEGREENRGG